VKYYGSITGQLVIAMFDLPAKASVLCAKQFNGQTGCSYCLNPGKRYQKPIPPKQTPQWI